MTKFKTGHLLFHRHHTTAFNLYIVHSLNDASNRYELLSHCPLPLSQDHAKELESLLLEQDSIYNLIHRQYTKIHHRSSYEFADSSPNVLSLQEYFEQMEGRRQPIPPQLKAKLFRFQDILSRHISSDANLVPHQGL